MDVGDVKVVETKIADALAGIGEQTLATARDAAVEAMKPLTLKFDELAGKVGQAAGDPAKLTQAVATAVSDALKAQAADAAKANADQTAQKAKADAKAKFIGEKAPKLPAAYQLSIPETDNAVELAAATEKAIAQYQADLKASGAVLPTAGTSADGTGTGNAADAAAAASKLSPMQKIEQGLKVAKS
jgi:hypothetical protein